MIHELLQGFSVALDPSLMIVMILAVVGGLVIGALPGLTATMGVAILVPLTFGMTPEKGLFILTAIFISAVQGGSISAILLNTPGTPASAVTTFDGYKLACRGEAGRALGMAQISAFIGLVISWLFLITCAPAIARVALKFAAPEYFAIALFGLTMVVSMCSHSLLKGFISCAFGLLLAMIGMDPMEGLARMTYGSDYLLGGIAYVPALIGLFAVAEVLCGVEDLAKSGNNAAKQAKKVMPNLKDLWDNKINLIRSSLIGTFLGSMPGVGTDVASFIAYGQAKNWSKHKDEIGNGSIEGVVAPEAGGKAVCGGAFIPMLSLGIPGDAVTAIILGSLMIWGITPGSQLFANNASLVYTLFAGFLIASVLTLIFGLSLAKVFVKVLSIPKRYILAAVFLLCMVGSYAINNSEYDVIVCMLFGILGYFMRKLDFHGSPIVLALILGSMLEANFRRSLVLSKGSYAIFFTRPICLAFLLLSVLSVVIVLRQNKKHKQGVSNNTSDDISAVNQ